MAAIEDRAPLVPSLLAPCYPEPGLFALPARNRPVSPLTSSPRCLSAPGLFFALLRGSVSRLVLALPIRLHRDRLPVRIVIFCTGMDSILKSGTLYVQE